MPVPRLNETTFYRCGITRTEAITMLRFCFMPARSLNIFGVRECDKVKEWTVVGCGTLHDENPRRSVECDWLAVNCLFHHTNKATICRFWSPSHNTAAARCSLPFCTAAKPPGKPVFRLSYVHALPCSVARDIADLIGYLKSTQMRGSGMRPIPFTSRSAI